MILFIFNIHYTRFGVYSLSSNSIFSHSISNFRMRIKHFACVSLVYIHLAVEVLHSKKMFSTERRGHMGQYSFKTNKLFLLLHSTLWSEKARKELQSICNLMWNPNQTCPCLSATKHFIILHSSYFGTIFDYTAKQMGVPEGHFNPAWPLSVWFSINQCV